MTCTLCGLEGQKTIIEEEKTFCCAGCRTVWHLLSARGGLDDFRSHPVFKQALSSGLISNPELVQKVKTADNGKRLTLEIREMWCPSCAEVIEMLLPREKGVASCKVDYATDLALIEYDPKKTDVETLFSFIKELGYLPLSLEEVFSRKGDKGLSFRFFVAAFCALNVMMLSYPIYASYFDYEPEGLAPILAWISFGFSLPVITYSLWPIARRFYFSLKTALYGMESLVMIGVGSSFALSTWNLINGISEVYFDTLTVIVAFVLLGKLIESKAKLTSKEAFYQLARSLPQKVRVNGVFVSVKDVDAGDPIECLAGERIPLDGVVIKGEALVNESAITGESLPVLRKKGDSLEAGGIIETGRLIIEVKGQESVLNRIIESCKVNLQHKSQYVRTLDPWVRLFVPVILVMALTLFLFTGSFSRSLTLLLISCPCAIGIAAPLVEFKMIQEISAMGAILRNRGALFKLPDITLWAFDKTGTLTEGILEVQGLDALSLSEKQILKGLASLSWHPISRAIAKTIQGEKIELERVFETEGEGIQAVYEGQIVLLGSHEYLKRNGIEVQVENDDFGEVWFYKGDKPHRLRLQDQTKKEAKSVIKSLAKTLLLSGDRQVQAEKLGKEVGIQEVLAPLKPFEKREVLRIRKLENETVAFVGDGLNDAPALAEADVGIATASSLGLAQAAADIILTEPSLEALNKLKTICIEGRRRIHQNLFWAFFYNIIGVALAIFGLLTPLFAAFAMTASSLIVVFNGRR